VQARFQTVSVVFVRRADPAVIAKAAASKQAGAEGFARNLCRDAAGVARRCGLR